MDAIDITVSGGEEAIVKLGVLADSDLTEVADTLGALGVSQTQRRIHSEKTSPSGEAWQKNRAGTSILFRSGALAASMFHTATSSAAMWGSPLVYAAIHNFGGTIRPKKGKALRFPGQAKQDLLTRTSVTMPKREYLGVSPDNATEMEQTIAALYLERLS